MSHPVRMSASDAAQSRILNDDDPMLQAALEQLAVTYSIRTILLWTLVIAPIVLTIIGIVLAIVLHTPVDDHGIASVPDRP
ncbi:hypothetical protein ACIOD2_27365 [Amycolatopsis sp. NPDC088138]|uniref:hypothetical protein n=1 Tax=Amycolatopsis sp. NPDC088138 TaxID=3363938 RepID=UPI00382B98F8